MALTLIVNGNQSDASNINQVIYVLQRQSGQQENGNYWLAGANTASSGIATVSNYIVSLSRGSTPASVGLTDAGHNGFNTAASAGNISQGGFQLFSGANPNQLNATASGTYAIHY